MPTREEVYTAIRNADAAGDSAGVRKLGDYLKTLPPEQSDTAPPVDMDAHRKRLGEIQTELKQIEADKPGLVGSVLGVGGNFLKGAADTALNLGSSMIATPAAGIAGLATTAGNLAAVPFSDVTVDDAVRRGSDVIQKGSQALTYQPRSDVGKEAQQIIAKPFEKLANVADSAGETVRAKTGSPLLATAVNTGIQFAPALLLKKRIKGGAQIAAEETPATGTAATGTTGTAAAAAATETPNVVRAKQYVANSLGLDWDALSKSVQDQLSSIAQDATKLDGLDPQAVAREIKFQSLNPPVPATRGTITRDPVAMRNEGNVSATEAGRPIRDIQLAGNQALLDNLDTLKGKVSGTGKTAATATTASDVGRSIQDSALSFKQAKSKANYDALFKQARETEPGTRVPISTVTDLLTSNPEVQHLGWVQNWLNKSAKLAGAKEGEPYQITDANLGELNDLRSTATAIARTGGKEGYYAGEVKKAIDSAMQGAPEGAAAWRKALDAYKAHQQEFSDQGAVAKLTGTKGATTDRAVALENTAKSITGGSVEDIQNVKRSLLTGGDVETRTAGRKAWRDLRAQVLEQIKSDATKSVSLNTDGTPNLSPAGLKKSIDAIGPERLDEIFGPGTTKQINKILEVARDAKTQPPTGAVGSSTFANVMAFLEKGLTKVPVGGDLVVGAAKLVGKAREIGAASRETAKATTTPLNEAVKQAAAKSKRERVIGKSDQLDATVIPLSQVGAQQAR